MSNNEVSPLTPWLERDLRKTLAKDEHSFLKWTADLPSREGLAGTGRYADNTPIPFASSPHCVAPIIYAMELADDRIRSSFSVLEIGFNRGHSAAIFLGANPACFVHSIDVVRHAEQERAIAVLFQRFNHSLERFRFMLRDDFDTWLRQSRVMPVTYDLVFIDGGHEYVDVVKDIELAESVSAKWILLDDWYPKWGPGVQPAVQACCLKLVAVFGNMALCQSGREYAVRGREDY